MIESVYILLVGAIIGNSVALICISLLADNGINLSALAAGAEYAGISRIIYPIVEMKTIITANLVVMVLGALVSLYPAVKAARFTPVEAMGRI